MARLLWSFIVLIACLCMQQLQASFLSRRLGRRHISSMKQMQQEEGVDETHDEVSSESSFCATSSATQIVQKQLLLQSLRLRGGASSSNDTSEKVKGTCIGIDLGTTYRYILTLSCFSCNNCDTNHPFSSFVSFSII